MLFIALYNLILCRFRTNNIHLSVKMLKTAASIYLVGRLGDLSDYLMKIDSEKRDQSNIQTAEVRNIQTSYNQFYSVDHRVCNVIDLCIFYDHVYQTTSSKTFDLKDFFRKSEEKVVPCLIICQILTEKTSLLKIADLFGSDITHRKTSGSHQTHSVLFRVLLTTFDLTKDELYSLNICGITWVKLGIEFDHWYSLNQENVAEEHKERHKPATANFVI